MKDEKLKSKAQIISGACCGIMMLLCVIIYLILGMTLNFWHPGWLIPACGGIACGIIGIVGETITNLKRLKEQENSVQNKEKSKEEE